MVTTIQIDEKVKERLDSLKVHHRESYNDLIVRILSTFSYKEVDRESLIESIEILSNPSLMRDLALALEEYEQGKGRDFSEIKKELNLDV